MAKNYEIWRPVKDFEGFYEVSSAGRLRSVERIIKFSKRGTTVYRTVKGRIMKPAINKRDGYALVILSKNGKTSAFHLHRLVAFAFPDVCGEWFDGCTVNHKDWDRSNNAASNLEVVSWEFNLRYRKPLPFKPVISSLRPIYVEDMITGEKHYFLRRNECSDFLGFNNQSSVNQYLKWGTPYKKRYLIKYVEETDERYDELKVLNTPTEEQVAFYQSTMEPRKSSHCFS